MKVLFINNDGAGFADYLDIAEGTTVDTFFQRQLPDGRPGDYFIRVNRQPVPQDYVLKEGDRVTMTPLKIEGALLQ
jgi:sulfur carrier protein ThiS